MQQHAFTKAFDSPHNSIDRNLFGPKHFPWRDIMSNNIGYFSKLIHLHVFSIYLTNTPTLPPPKIQGPNKWLKKIL
jgi:hypothetical protein